MFMDRDHQEIEKKLLQAAFKLAAQEGWHRFKLCDAAKEAHLSSEIMRRFFPFKTSLIFTLNRHADEAALHTIENNISLRDRIFESFMQRFDVFQDYREGLRAILHAIPKDPALAAITSTATMNSMRWIADHVGLDRKGILGFARLNTLFLIWLKTLHMWEKDTTPDLSETMNILNLALEKAERHHFLKEVSIHVPQPDNVKDSLKDDFTPPMKSAPLEEKNLQDEDEINIHLEDISSSSKESDSSSLPDFSEEAQEEQPAEMSHTEHHQEKDEEKI